MNPITLTLKYGGAMIDTQVFPEEHMSGTIYPVEMNGQYSFTLLENEDQDWSVMKEQNAVIPFVENELFNLLVKKLQHELRYAA